ncbi:uncharacterized protein BXZ73DRAFT_99581 [Epithele typhae]|uniref:uncharacterized protein n=1 Tax=Epithele typhae TaxID=378194 RepID=UPI0020086E30|nr:uncharacterized protein BXZ73DRAFT_99581 [Epithele typhae]KAH9939378.1 hypothetical protein BXZ73DRAFT_99581 [Epithele typhae]
MSDPQLIDDTNPIVQYQGGWDWQQGVDAVDNTRHAVSADGLIASLSFSGTGIQVVGQLEPSSNWGTPLTSYTIDNQLVGQYQAGSTSSTQQNVTFFSKLDLAYGNHEIVIKHIGTTGTYFLDFFLVYKSQSSNVATTKPAKNPTTTTTSTTSTTQRQQQQQQTTSTNVPPTTVTTSSQTTSTTTTTSSSVGDLLKATNGSSSTTTSGISSVISPSTSRTSSANMTATRTSSTPLGSTATRLGQTAISDGSSGIVPTNTASPDGSVTGNNASGAGNNPSSSASHNSNLGAIVGGTIGGIALLAFLLIAFVLWRKRRSHEGTITLALMDPLLAADVSLAGFAPLRRPVADVHPFTQMDDGLNRTESAPYGAPSPKAFGGADFSHMQLAAAARPASMQFVIPSSRAAYASDNLSRGTTAAHTPAAFPYDAKAARALYGAESQRLGPPSSSSSSHLLSPVTEYSAPSAAHDAVFSPTDTYARSDFGGGAGSAPSVYGGVETATSPETAGEAARAPWYAPATQQTQAASLLHAISQRSAGSPAEDGGSAGGSGGRARREPRRAPTQAQDVDSGLRMYNEPTLPPPYTPD